MLRLATKVLAVTVGLVGLGSFNAGAASAEGNGIFTVAGGGVSLCNGCNALTTNLVPHQAEPTPDGGFLVSDTLNDRVRKVSPSGNITTLVGGGGDAVCSPSCAATAVSLNDPAGLAVLPGGGFLIADRGNNRIRMHVGGTVTNVAGDGTTGTYCDPGPCAATSVSVNQPYDVAATADGFAIAGFADGGRFRRVAGGQMHTVVPVTCGCLSSPIGVALEASGDFLVTESSGHQVSRITPGGVVTAVAGTGTGGYTGDGGFATAAQINAPVGIAVAPDASFIFADSQNQRIRRVSPSGRITTIAGSGMGTFAGDGGPALSAGLSTPFGLSITPEGGFYIGDVSNNRIRFVDADLRPGPAGPPGTNGTNGTNGSNGANGSPGAPGTTGTQGTPGTNGTNGTNGANGTVTTVDRLYVALVHLSIRAKRNTRFPVRFLSTTRGTVRLEVLKGSRRVAQALGTARAGMNRLTLKLPATAGAYRLRLTVISGSQRSTDTVPVTVRR